MAHLTQPHTAAVFEELVRQRRATPHFGPDEVPWEVIEAALKTAAEAPSGYNIQPWRFILVRDPAVRERLRQAAFNQEKITEAPLVIIAWAEHDAWQDRIDEILQTRARHSGRTMADTTKIRQNAVAFINTLPRDTWLNRQVMIAFTYLMLAFEAQGWDTAPMEGFDAGAVRKVVALPDNAAVVALLAVGRGIGNEPVHPGRLGIGDIAFVDRFGEPIHLNPLAP